MSAPLSLNEASIVRACYRASVLEYERLSARYGPLNPDALRAAARACDIELKYGPLAL